jgi:hypothetical protein
LAQADEKRVWIEETVLAFWNSLNPVEKYFALLEAWLIHASADVLGKQHRQDLGCRNGPLFP